MASEKEPKGDKHARFHQIPTRIRKLHSPFSHSRPRSPHGRPRVLSYQFCEHERAIAKPSSCVVIGFINCFVYLIQMIRTLEIPTPRSWPPPPPRVHHASIALLQALAQILGPRAVLSTVHSDLKSCILTALSHSAVALKLLRVPACVQSG